MLRGWIVALVLALALGAASPLVAQERKRPDEEAKELARVVEKLTGLKFKKDVPVGLKSREELRAKLVEDFAKEFPPEKAAIATKIYVALGLVPRGTDLSKLMLDLLTEQIGGFYDPKAKELFLIEEYAGKNAGEEEGGDDGDAASKAMKSLMGGMMDMNRIITVHELTHAMQDQHFDLLTLPMEDETNDDLVEGVKSLVEGEATYTMYQDLFGKMGLNIDTLPMNLTKMLESGGAGAGPGAEQLEKAPVYLRESLIFPYMKGFTFIQAVKKHGGWAAVHKLFSDLPASTEQIIHPEKYLADERDNPVLINLPDLSGTLGKGWTLLGTNRMGELNIHCLFKTFFTNTKAAEIKQVSAGWGGDQYHVFEKDGKLALAWFTTWDTEKDATEFLGAYAKLVGKKFDTVETVTAEKGVRHRFKLDGAQVLVERHGQDVLVLEGLDAGLTDTVAQELWGKTTREVLKEVKRVTPKAAAAKVAEVIAKKTPKAGDEDKTAKAAKPDGIKTGAEKTATGKGGVVKWSAPGATLTLTVPAAVCEFKATEAGAEVSCKDAASLVRFVAYPRAEGDTLETAGKEARARLKESLPGFKLVHQTPTDEYAGLHGLDIVCTGTPGEVGQPCVIRGVLLEGKKNVYVVIHTIASADQDKCHDCVEAMLKSLKIEEK